jgi:hypothetical protein
MNKNYVLPFRYKHDTVPFSYIKRNTNDVNMTVIGYLLPSQYCQQKTLAEFLKKFLDFHIKTE